MAKMLAPGEVFTLESLVTPTAQAMTPPAPRDCAELHRRVACRQLRFAACC